MNLYVDLYLVVFFFYININTCRICVAKIIHARIIFPRFLVSVCNQISSRCVVLELNYKILFKSLNMK
jgi:hypothetical protein